MVYLYYMETLTPQRVRELARLTFKILGYNLTSAEDGKISVNCSLRTAQAVDMFQQLLVEELKTSK